MDRLTSRSGGRHVSERAVFTTVGESGDAGRDAVCLRACVAGAPASPPGQRVRAVRERLVCPVPAAALVAALTAGRRRSSPATLG